MNTLATLTYSIGGVEYTLGLPHLTMSLVLAVLVIAGMWAAFRKAKQPGWAAIIPIYNTLVMLWVAGKPWWWILLLFLAVIPIVGWVVALAVAIIVYYNIAKRFGRGVGMTLLLLLLPFIGWPVLGFGSAKYKKTK